MIIYKATNIVNGKVYIGASKHSNLEIRKHGHLFDAFQRKKEHYSYFQRALRKYGESNFNWEIIDNTDSYDTLMEKEKYWVKRYNSFGKNGYNSCEGGGNTKGYKFSEESKKRISEKAKKRVNDKNPFYGKTHSLEQKEKWSKERKGRKLEGEWLENIKKARKKNCKQVINLDTMEIFNSIGEAQEKYRIKNGIAGVCKNGKTAGGCHWMFYKEYLEQNHDDTVPR